MRDVLKLALDAASGSGVSYAEARIVQEKSQSITTKNGKVGSIRQDETFGLGIRVIAHGAWGFAATDDLSPKNVKRIAKKAVAIAKASALCKTHDIQLASEEKHVSVWRAPFTKDPWAVPLSDKVDLLLKVDETCRKVKGVTAVEGNMNFVRETKYFLSSLGSDIEQHRFRTGAGFSVSSFTDGELFERSYPASFGGQYSCKGYEMVDEINLLDNAQRIAEEAVALHSAPQCESGVKDLILETSQLALQIHESIGHPIELDRVLGTEANYAGTSFLTLDKLNKLQYGSKHMNVVADATLAHGQALGTFGFDDEGVPAQRNWIVKDGLFVGYMTSRETAPVVGASRSNGCMRADGWNRIPLIRMTNVSLEPGDGKFADLVADTKDGIYMSTVRSWSIDDKRYNFQFGPEIAWEIKDGKLGRMLKNPSYGGITTEFWNSMDAVCGKPEWVLWSVPNCGKGQPGQSMGTGHGCAPARFRNVKIGVAFG